MKWVTFWIRLNFEILSIKKHLKVALQVSAKFLNLTEVL